METLSDKLLTFLLNAAWQIAAVTAFAAIANRLMQSSPAAYRHILWVAALIVAVLLPIASVNKAASQSSLLSVVAPPVPPTPTNSTPGAAPPLFTPAVAPEPVRFSALWARITIFLYAFLVVWGIARLLISWRESLRIRTEATLREPEPPLAGIWQESVGAFKLRRVELLSSATLSGPVTLGAFHPAVIVPERFWSETSADVLKAAIGHELAHVARRDFAANMVHQLLYIPISFHPATWFLRKKIEHTREMACDEAVTARLLEPRRYARSILQMAESATVRVSPGCTLGVLDGSMLEDRVRRLLRGTATSAGRARLLLATSLSALTFAVLMASAMAMSARAQSPFRDRMKEGVAAYNSGDFRSAVNHFTSAVSLQPDRTDSKLYLANALMREFYSQSEPDARLLSTAHQQYAEILERDAANRQALAGMSALAMESRQFDEARQYAEKLSAADPNDRSAWYTLGVLDWTAVFPEYLRTKQAAGARQEDYTIPDANARQAFRNQHGDRVEVGIIALQKALSIDPNYHEAMAYLNLLYRIKAAMAEDPTQASQFIAEADRWIGMALKARQAGVSPSVSQTLDPDGPPPGPAGRNTMVKAPPPPPPPPPSRDRSQQIASSSPPPGPLDAPLVGQYWQIIGSKDTVAIELFRQLRARGFESVLHGGSDGQVRVLAGPYFDNALAERNKTALEEAGFRVLRRWQ